MSFHRETQADIRCASGVAWRVHASPILAGSDQAGVAACEWAATQVGWKFTAAPGRGSSDGPAARSLRP
jgi:hypothetical protein